ncbi:446_t:CDS:1, partial [Cetraspora pellucida]
QQKAPIISNNLRRTSKTSPVKLNQKRKAISITEVLDTYYMPEILVEENNDILTNKIKDPMPTDNETISETILENLIDEYLELLKNFTLEPRKGLRIEHDNNEQKTYNYYLKTVVNKPKVLGWHLKHIKNVEMDNSK